MNSPRTRFYRDKANGKIMGVCAGIADYTGVDVMWIRLGAILLTLMGSGILIPIYFLIGGFGGENRSYAAVKFLLYNLFGGLLMLASVVGLYAESAKSEGGATYLLSELSQLDMGTNVERWLSVANSSTPVPNLTMTGVRPGCPGSGNVNPAARTGKSFGSGVRSSRSSTGLS